MNEEDNERRDIGEYRRGFNGGVLVTLLFFAVAWVAVWWISR